MQTASEIMAAKRQAKQALKIKRSAHAQIGTGKIHGDRNRRASIERNQHSHRRDLQHGAPCDEDANLTDAIRNLLAYGDLVYRHDAHAATVYEKLIRASQKGSYMVNIADIAAWLDQCHHQAAHPDTKRLDWIVENGANIEDIDGYFRISIDPECDPHLVGNHQAIRRVIDTQMADGKYLQCHSPD